MRAAIQVRAAEAADVERLIALTEEASATVGPSTRDRDAGPVLDARRARYARLVADPDRVVLVAVDEEHDALVGLVVATEDELSATSPLRVLVVGNLIVALRERRRGVGRALLCALVRQADERGIEQIVVAAASQDRDANRYLARLGFHPLVIRRIAATTTLRRSLGMTELFDRASIRRRRGHRTVRGVLPQRISRGA